MKWVLCLLFVSKGFSFSSHLETSSQLIVVITEDWTNIQGIMRCFEKTEEGKWQQIGNDIPTVVGKNGMGWGLGLHEPIDEEPLKREGDGKSPAGIFTLGTAFGHTAIEHMMQIKMPYLEINPWTEAIGDPKSQFYNQILDTRNIIEPDWNPQKNEQMGSIALYLRGIVINHNESPAFKGRGSHIFLHIWRLSNYGTAGCTAVSPENMDKLFYWLDPQKKPLIIQFPKVVQSLVMKQWKIEDINFNY